MHVRPWVFFHSTVRRVKAVQVSYWNNVRAKTKKRKKTPTTYALDRVHRCRRNIHRIIRSEPQEPRSCERCTLVYLSDSGDGDVTTTALFIRALIRHAGRESIHAPKAYQTCPDQYIKYIYTRHLIHERQWHEWRRFHVACLRRVYLYDVCVCARRSNAGGGTATHIPEPYGGWRRIRRTTIIMRTPSAGMAFRTIAPSPDICLAVSSSSAAACRRRRRRPPASVSRCARGLTRPGTNRRMCPSFYTRRARSDGNFRDDTGRSAAPRRRRRRIILLSNPRGPRPFR